MTTSNQGQTAGPIRLSSGTWVGISAIAVPTILAIIVGVLGIYDVKNGLTELRKDVEDGFEKTDGNIVQVRERVARLEAVSDVQAPNSAAAATTDTK